MSQSSISVIIPTLNEELCLEALLSSRALAGASEVIVADGQSTDRTVEIARRYARVVVTAPSRARQMNAGARVATGSILLFLHADVQLGEGALQAIQEAMSDHRIVGGNLDIRYAGGDRASAIFSRLNRQRRRWLRIFYGDSCIFCRREVFQQLGQYPDWPLMEDREFARRLVRAGPLAFLDEPVFVSARRWQKAGLAATMAIWWWIELLFFLGVDPHRLAGWYRSVR